MIARPVLGMLIFSQRPKPLASCSGLLLLTWSAEASVPPAGGELAPSRCDVEASGRSSVSSLAWLFWCLAANGVSYVTIPKEKTVHGIGRGCRTYSGKSTSFAPVAWMLWYFWPEKKSQNGP